MINDYIKSMLLSAISNEAAIDFNAARRLGLLPEKFCLVFPRSIKTNKVSVFLSPLFECRLVDLVSSFFLILFLTFFFFFLIFTPKKNKAKSLLASFSHEGVDYLVINKHGKINLCVNSVFSNKMEGKGCLLEELNVFHLSLISIRSFFVSICWVFSTANIAFILNKNKGETSFFRLSQSYVVFELVFSYSLIKNHLLKNRRFDSIVFCNHYDRWAVMADHLGMKCTMIQHGNIGCISLPYRICSVDSLFVYNKEQEQMFKDFVISPCTYDLEVSYFTSKLNLVYFDKAGKNVSALYVGESYNLQFESSFIVSLLSYYPDLHLIYKPHPRAGFKNTHLPTDHPRFFIFDSLCSFPIVDYVFSYNSTLGYEYQRNGFTVFNLANVQDVDAFFKGLDLNKRTSASLGRI